MKLVRPSPLFIEREDGRVYRIDPCSRAQMRDVLALDPIAEHESELEADARISQQLRLLIGESGLAVDPQSKAPLPDAPRIPLDALTAEEERQLLFAIIAKHLGKDPAHAAATQVMLPKIWGAMFGRASETKSSNDSTGTVAPSPATSEPTSAEPISSDSPKA